MRSLYKGMFCFGLCALFAITASVALAQQQRGSGTVSAISVPAVQLKHWKNSTVQERRAFLMGFLSMLEMEHTWQGKDGLAVAQSTVPTWWRGLAGVSIPEMDDALNQYIAAHPNAMDRTVIEALGRIYVRPKLSKNEREDAAKRYDVLKAGFTR
ncbi:MAG: hypothetical protein LIP28_09965 [Deltaproteobacteria bacterium]|nr:hypothetical protein [Deltaproteobacteria bacterium]